MTYQPTRREALQYLATGILATGAFGVDSGVDSTVQAEERLSKEGHSRIRVGQIGVGHAHATKLSVYRRSPDYEVVGICEPNSELRRKAEKNPAYAGLPWLSVDELLATPGLQAVLVETEIRDLLTMAEKCVAAGKHVHIDKPAGASLPQFKRILDQAEKQNLMVQLGYMYRYNPAVVLLHQFLKEGWLGEVFEVQAVMSKVLDPGTRKELAEYSGGTMFELGCHLIDLVVSILGSPETVTPYLQNSSSLNDGLADNCLAVMTWPRANATIRSSGLEVEGFQRRHLTVCGTEGTFHIQPLDNPSVVLSLSQPRGEYKKGTQTLTMPKYQRYVDDAADMAKVIRGQKVSDFPYAHELAVQTTLLKASQMPDV